MPPDIVKKYLHQTHTKYKRTYGDQIIEFCETLKVPSGRDVGQMVVLRDWQRNIIKAIYDPIDETTRLRIVREACITMARKNAKTTLAAMLVLSHLVGPVCHRNGEIYSAGFRRDQASIIWRCLYQMISVDDELSLYCTWSRTHKTVDCGRFGTFYKAISAEAKSKHGFNPIFVVLDELSQFGGDRTLYDVFKTAMGAQDESLLLTISTQAADDLAVMSEIIDYGHQVDSGEIDDPSFVLIEYSTDDYDDIQDPETWKKANPALDDFRSLSELKQMADRAKTSPSAEQTFRNLYLNQRVASTISLVSPSIWRLNGEKQINIALGRKAYVALDLSDRIDLTCMMVLLPDDDGLHIDCVPYFFTPQDTLEERTKRDRVPYIDWAGQGYMIAVPGKSIDYRFVSRKLIEVCEDFDVQLVVFDRWRIKLFWAALELEGYSPESLSWMEHGQGFRDMAPAIDATEEDLLGARLRHGMHPVLTFNAGCCKVSKDPAGNRKFDKLKSNGKIDGMVALAMGLHAIHQANEGGARSVYEHRDVMRIGGTVAPRDIMPQPPVRRSVWDHLDTA